MEGRFYPASKRADTMSSFVTIRSIDRVYMRGRELNEDGYVSESNHRFRGLSDHTLAYRVSQTPGNLTAFA